MRGVQNLEGGVTENGDFRQGGQDALYPALSGEWEVPVTRNAKITPVNEGGYLQRACGGRSAKRSADRFYAAQQRAFGFDVLTFATLYRARGHVPTRQVTSDDRQNRPSRRRAIVPE